MYNVSQYKNRSALKTKSTWNIQGLATIPLEQVNGVALGPEFVPKVWKTNSNRETKYGSKKYVNSSGLNPRKDTLIESNIPVPSYLKMTIEQHQIT